jgi:hypothetical protein
MKRRWTVLLVTGLAIALWAGAGSADAQTAPRDQTSPDLVYKLDREEYQLVWSEDRGAGHRIFSKRIRPNGLPIGGPNGGEWELTGATGVGAAEGQKGDQRNPALVDGVVVWSELAPGGTDYDLYIQRLFGNGRASGQPRLLLTRPGDQKFPDLVAVSRGLASEILVVWSENTTDSGDIMGLRLTGALTPRGAPFAIATGPSTAEDPVISRDLRDPDSLLVLWTDDRKGNKDIYGTRVLENGLPRGGAAVGDFPVIESAADDYAPAIAISPFPTRRAGIIQPGGINDPDTRGILVWTTDSLTDGPDVQGQRLFPNGLPLGHAFPIAAAPGVQASPAVTLKVEQGKEDQFQQVGWLAVWVDQPTTAGATLDVYGVEVELNGISRRPERALAAD